MEKKWRKMEGGGMREEKGRDGERGKGGWVMGVGCQSGGG